MVSIVAITGRVGVLRYGATSFTTARRNINVYDKSYMTPTFGAPYPYQDPFPYKEKKFTIITEHFDYTKPRFNENTKVILVEGNLASGKHEFAEKLAKGFDLKYFPATPEDNCFKLEWNNYDLREFNQFLPKRSQYYDLEDFLTDPHPQSGRIGQLQIALLTQKFKTYCNALTHLFNTGQGVVLVRSVFSDHVFNEALRKCGYVTNEFKKFHDDWERNSIVQLMKPHLTIYLDTPVDKVRENINKRGNELEVNSKNLTDEFFHAIEDSYKNSHFPRMEKSGIVLEIDPSEIVDEVDMDSVLEEISTINMATDDSEDTKFRDWFDMTEDYASFYRRKYASGIIQKECFARDRPMQCPEILWHDDDLPLMHRVMKFHPAMLNKAGWAREFGNNPLMRID